MRTSWVTDFTPTYKLHANYQGRIFWGGAGRCAPPQTLTSTPQKNRNWHRLQTFALWQSRFAFITQKKRS